MTLQVETYPGDAGAKLIKRFRFNERFLEVTENMDQWHGEGYSYFKVKADDDNLYILRFDQAQGEWSLTMFKAQQLSKLSKVFH